nr:alpha/beta hydrolase [Nonomuraea guangzhouensis]
MARHDPVAETTHRLVLSGTGRIHLVEQGSGPLVLLVHGFPESWYSWRHQLPVLAAFVSPGGTLRDRFPIDRLPAWLSEDDLDVYAAEFERTGMSGALNRYRNMDRDWEDLAGFDGSPITQPSLFIGGALDASTTWLADAIKAYPVTLPGLVSSHILDGCGHWIQQERPEEVNEILSDWLASLR